MDATCTHAIDALVIASGNSASTFHRNEFSWISARHNVERPLEPKTNNSNNANELTRIHYHRADQAHNERAAEWQRKIFESLIEIFSKNWKLIND